MISNDVITIIIPYLDPFQLAPFLWINKMTKRINYGTHSVTSELEKYIAQSFPICTFTNIGIEDKFIRPSMPDVSTLTFINHNQQILDLKNFTKLLSFTVTHHCTVLPLILILPPQLKTLIIKVIHNRSNITIATTQTNLCHFESNGNIVSFNPVLSSPLRILDIRYHQKEFDMNQLAHLTRLKKLTIEGNIKNPQIINQLPSLIHLNLYPFNKLDFLPKLNVLSIGLNSKSQSMSDQFGPKVRHMYLIDDMFKPVPSTVYSLEIIHASNVPTLHANVRFLKLYNIKYNSLHKLLVCTNLLTLKLNKCDIENINELYYCTELRSINISNCHMLENLNGLMKCIHLRSIEIFECSALTNINGLKGCKNLIELNIKWEYGENKIDVIELEQQNKRKHDRENKIMKRTTTMIEEMARDSARKYDDENDDDYDFIDYNSDDDDVKKQKEKRIKIRKLIKNTIIEVMKEEYSFSENEDEDISWNEQKFRNKVTDISVLKYCPKLQILTLTDSTIQNLDVLANCMDLRDLDLTRSHNLNNIDGIKECAKIEHICLCNCERIWDLTALNTHYNLRNLDLGGCNMVFDFPQCGNKLETVQLDETSVLNVSHLKEQTKLRYIDLQNCPASNDMKHPIART